MNHQKSNMPIPHEKMSHHANSLHENGEGRECLELLNSRVPALVFGQCSSTASHCSDQCLSDNLKMNGMLMLPKYHVAWAVSMMSYYLLLPPLLLTPLEMAWTIHLCFVNLNCVRWSSTEREMVRGGGTVKSEMASGFVFSTLPQAAFSPPLFSDSLSMSHVFVIFQLFSWFIPTYSTNPHSFHLLWQLL